MNIPAAKLGLPNGSDTEIINLKCEPALLGGLRQSSGVYPAYHMNKEHWFSLDLNSDFAAEEVLRLLDLSFDLTR
ncbi:MmcQ/YjbR family DNA-binding protein [Neisseria sp. ZJ106]|uniref:MmcQ/YjbR family DNA-binding protein n=1 Tax=Neisseria lisongii TaxID=2912188 RepID=A0ABY7RIM2_9NEIS|nr:MmcQ/YjbR family DNA-binding protein [Neisseria lisongii]MCF7521901.1 MmcQ/YjbR family DNA-binding protein [Neisseria lisongii]WCL71137.1 MmcQ/YjbR family DNA-binding protein [Neisseria lisongii]